jgi:type II secretion system protein G
VNTAKTLKPGFSIVEVMIVVLVGGLLAAMAFGGFKYLQTAKVNDTQRRLANLDAALQTYQTQLDQYPENLEELVEGPSNPKLQIRWAGEIAKEKELKDAWQQPFVYERLSRGYDLYSRGAKGNLQIRSPQAIDFAEQQQ